MYIQSTESLDTKSLGDGDKPDRVPDSNGGVGERLKVEWMIRPYIWLFIVPGISQNINNLFINLIWFD